MDSFIDKPTFDNQLLLKLQCILQIPDHEYQLAITQQRSNIQNAKRLSFKPCIEAVFSSNVTSPIVAAQFFLNIPIPRFIDTMNFNNKMRYIFGVYKANLVDLLIPSSSQNKKTKRKT